MNIKFYFHYIITSPSIWGRYKMWLMGLSYMLLTLPKDIILTQQMYTSETVELKIGIININPSIIKHSFGFIYWLIITLLMNTCYIAKGYTLIFWMKLQRIFENTIIIMLIIFYFIILEPGKQQMIHAPQHRCFRFNIVTYGCCFVVTGHQGTREWVGGDSQ